MIISFALRILLIFLIAYGFMSMVKGSYVKGMILYFICGGICCIEFIVVFYKELNQDIESKKMENNYFHLF